MITVLTLSRDEFLPNLIAYEGGVFLFNFVGDQTYTDDEGSTWTWVGVGTVAPNISGVRAGNVQLVEVTTLSDCIDNSGTFYYESPVLYVHYQNSSHDVAIDSSRKVSQNAAIFISNNLDNHLGYLDGAYYEPTLASVSGLSLEADPLKFGLLTASTSTAEVQNNDGKYDNIQLAAASGSIAEILNIPENGTLADARVAFKGFTNGVQRTESGLVITIQEQRFFYNVPACPNVATVADYANIASRFENKPLPIAFGDIRRGKVMPINTDGIGTNDTGTITFCLADPALGNLVDINTVKLYDANGDELTISARNNSANTVSYSKSSGSTSDFANFSWEGKGYDIPGTYNNGLDIIKFCLLNQGGLLFVNGVFDVAEWTAQTALNTEAIGISVASTRGITEEIIEPVTVSLQGVVISRGDGRLTYLDRNTALPSIAEYDVTDLLSDITVDYDTSSLVSSVVVEYAPNFADNDDVFSLEDVTEEQRVIETYGIKTRDPISPVRTVLYSQADAETIAAEILDTSTDPQQIVSITVPYTIDFDIEPFDMVTINLRRYDGATDLKRCEVLSVAPDYDNYTVQIKARYIEDADGRDIVDGGGVAAWPDVFDGGGVTEQPNILDPGGV